MEPWKVSDKCNLEDVDEAIVSRCLRSRAFIRTLEGEMPMFETGLQKSQYAKKSQYNRWFADEYGIVIHYPEAIYVTGPDFGSFRAIPVGHNNLKFEYFDRICNSMNLHATKDLIALEIRRNRWMGYATVYNRNSLKLVYERGDFLGHFYTRSLDNEMKLFVQEDRIDDSRVHINQISKGGEEVFVWKGFSYCDCKGSSRLCLTCHHRKIVLRHCYFCNEGMLENMDTNEDTEDYKISGRAIPLKIHTNWIDSSNILAIEERIPSNDLLRSVALLNMESGKIELDFPTIYGDIFRCYAVSLEYLVVCYRHIRNKRPNKNKLTNMIVKNRQTGERKEFQVPEFSEKIRTIKLLSGSILVALPYGTTRKESGLDFERVYTMDLEEEDPRSSILSFRVPTSEVRTIGNSKIICKMSTKCGDYFRIYNLVKCQ